MSCIVCKKLWVPGCTHTFHKFPKDLQRRQKWMEIIGISKVTNNSLVCSDHFSTKSYHETDGYTTIKRLLSTAEPAIDTNAKVNVKNETKNLENDFHNESSNSECREIINSNKESNKIVDNSTLIKSMNETQTNTNEKSSSVHQKERLLLRLDSVSDVINDTVTKEICLKHNILNVKVLENINQVDSNTSCNKRKNFENDQKSYPNKRFRFMDGYTAKTISREDFKTDKGWNNFMRYVTIQRNKNSVNRRKQLRSRNKIKSFKDLINSLKEKNTEASVEYLKVRRTIHSYFDKS